MDIPRTLAVDNIPLVDDIPDTDDDFGRRRVSDNDFWVASLVVVRLVVAFPSRSSLFVDGSYRSSLRLATIMMDG